MKHSHGYILTAPGLKKKRALGPQHSGFLFLRPRYPSQGQKTSHPNNLALTDKHQQYDRCHRKTKQNKTNKKKKKRRFRAANHPSSFSQSERHKQYSVRKARRVAAMFASQPSNSVKGSCNANKTFQISNSACLLMTRNISCNQTR